MSKGINLLKTEKKISVSPASAKVYVARLIAIIILFGISAISIILFLLILLSPLPNLQNQEKNLLATAANSHPDMAKLVFIKDRVKSSQTIINNRQHFDQSLGLIQKRMTSDLQITELSMNKGKLAVTVASTSLSSLNDFLNKLADAVDTKQDFSKITLTNYLADETGNKYSVTVEVVML